MPQTVEGAQTPYEVYCHACRVTFPVGTRRCLHCGGRLGARGGMPFRGPPVLGAPRPGPLRPGLPRPGLPDGEDEEDASLTLRRFGGLALWALVVASALISNLCGR